MSTYPGFEVNPTTLKEIESMIAKGRRSWRMRYAKYLNELLHTLPPESAKRLLRAHLQRDPRWAGQEIPDSVVDWEYSTLDEF